MVNPCKDDTEEFLVPKDIPSAENPTMCYRWREIEWGKNVIRLGSEGDLHQMTLADGRRRVNGTWGSSGDPGNVEFSGVNVSGHTPLERDRMGISIIGTIRSSNIRPEKSGLVGERVLTRRD
jgi:hypothetical protein